MDGLIRKLSQEIEQHYKDKRLGWYEPELLALACQILVRVDKDGMYDLLDILFRAKEGEDMSLVTYHNFPKMFQKMLEETFEKCDGEEEEK